MIGEIKNHLPGKEYCRVCSGWYILDVNIIIRER
jgi:hypothetical protein